MKITSLKTKACVLAGLGLMLGSAMAEDQNRSDVSRKDSPASQQQVDKNSRATDATYGAKAAVGAPVHYNKVSSLLGMAIHDQNGEKIGDIKDLAIDTQGNKVAYAVFGTDGKERLFAIPLSAFQPGDQKHLMLSIDKTKYDAAKGFEKNNWPALNSNFQSDMFWTTPSTTASVSADASADQAAAGVSVDVDASVDGAVKSDSPAVSANQTEAAPTEESLTPTGKDSATRSTSGVIGDHQKASKILGMNIKNSQGEDLGEIKDIVVDLQSGKISYAVLAYGGRLGIGQKMVAVPLSAFTTGGQAKGFVLNADKARLESAQGFEKDNWPSVNNPTWGADKFWEDKGANPGQYRNQQNNNADPSQNDANRNQVNPNDSQK